jgi:hypothetical protein
MGETALRQLITAKSVHSITAVGRDGGFAVSVRFGTAQQILASDRHDVRLFPNLTTLAAFLARLGAQRFEVDVTGYRPGRVRKPRPDRAAALRVTRTTPRQTNFFTEDS